MSRAHAETRVSEQIRTLFQAGSLGALTDGQLLDLVFCAGGHVLGDRLHGDRRAARTNGPGRLPAPSG